MTEKGRIITTSFSLPTVPTSTIGYVLNSRTCFDDRDKGEDDLCSTQSQHGGSVALSMEHLKPTRPHRAKQLDQNRHHQRMPMSESINRLMKESHESEL